MPIQFISVPNRFQFRRCALPAAVMLSTLVALGCTTQREISAPKPALPPSEKTPETQTPTPEPKNNSTSSGLSNAQLAQFHVALAKRDCPAIRSLEDDVNGSIDNTATVVQLAVSWCAHQKSPQDKDKLTAFLNLAEQAQKIESPLLNTSFIEQLKGEALASSGDSTAARASFARAMSGSALQFMSMVSGQALRSDLQNIETLLTGAQAALLRDVRTSLAEPATQAAALTKLDELLSQVPAGGVYDKLAATRLKLFAAFELSFASQLATLEETRLKGDMTALETVSVTIRRFFPSRPHQLRIDSITGKASAAEGPSTQQGNQCAALTPAAVLSSTDRSDLTADKALQIAKMALNDGKPGDAVEILDSLSEANKNERTRSLRREASEAHVKDMRRKASELYKRVAMTSDAQAKLDSLSQCKQILENILVRYPDTDTYTKRNIQKFLNSVSENITELRKGQVK